MRILIIRPSALGDVCRTVPVLASLRQAFPEAAIDWVVQAGFEDAVRAHPMLGRVIQFPRKEFAGWWRSPRVMRDVIAWARALARAKYDMVFDCQGLGRSGAMTWMTRAPKRIGLRSAREGAWLAYNHRCPPSPSPHTVDEMLWLLECEGIEIVRDMRLYVDDADAGWWRERRTQLDVDGPYAVLAPTSRWLSKRWPIERWSELLNPLRERGLAHAVVVGAPGEREQVMELIGRDDVIDLVGASSVGQTMAVIREASLVLANDSAPLHMAVGFDRPAVGLFGPTDPARVGPYTKGETGQNCAVIRAVHSGEPGAVNFRNDRLGDSLMRTIPSTEVIRQIDAVLAGTERSAAPSRHTLDANAQPNAAGTDALRQTGFVKAPARPR